MIYQSKKRIEVIQFTGNNHSDCRNFAKRFDCRVSIRKSYDERYDYHIIATSSVGTGQDLGINIGDYFWIQTNDRFGWRSVEVGRKQYIEESYEECKDDLLDRLECCETCYHAITPTCCNLDECKWEIRRDL